ncbi:glycosyltransferase family 4 protein [Lacibacter sediminis]|uniref:Glycosyltransferase family 4 protein n=1 Tax=Lacibacter sediminis TaxID=2760713 RepID=A0A7G5XHN4_9BACT|nr:glycosyltransferase family 4 protein [Lacibacter sediminis]QNA44987.1 glycosyltransferase family 4 protein [Lacibacter sediminis]
MKRKVVLHLVTWYPSSDNNIDGIFIRRHVELLRADNSYEHIVVQKSSSKFSIVQHLLSLLGSFTRRVIGTTEVIQLPVESVLYNRFFWRYKKAIEKKQVEKLVRKYKPLLCHLHVVYGFGEEAVYLKKHLGIPFIVTEHMAPFPFDWLHNKQQTVIQPMLEATTVTAVGQAQANQIEAYTGVKPVIVHNMVSAKEFFYKAHATIDPSVKLEIIFVGIYDKRKGVDYLLKVFPQFLQQYPKTVLHLVGNADEERMKLINESVEEGKIASNVKFHGRLAAAELCQLFHSCDFYVCSSEWESFGVSVLEALFTGLPVLSTACGGVQEFMRPDNGLLISNDRTQKTLLNGLLQMTANIHSYNREFISTETTNRFSGERIRNDFYSIYNQVQG